MRLSGTSDWYKVGLLAGNWTRTDTNLGTPPHALVVATATQFSNIYQHAVEEVFLMNAEKGGVVNPFVRSDMVYFEGPKRGDVFSVGSITWAIRSIIWRLITKCRCGYDPSYTITELPKSYLLGTLPITKHSVHL